MSGVCLKNQRSSWENVIVRTVFEFIHPPKIAFDIILLYSHNIFLNILMYFTPSHVFSHVMFYCHLSSYFITPVLPNGGLQAGSHAGLPAGASSWGTPHAWRTGGGLGGWGVILIYCDLLNHTPSCRWISIHQTVKCPDSFPFGLLKKCQ